MSELSNSQRLLKLKEIFMYESDEDHKLSLEDIYDKISEITGSDFEADRRSIKKDMDILRKNGFYIEHEEGKRKKKLYYYADRHFEFYELRLLIDAVSSAKFITVCESEKLIQKLKNQTSIYAAEELQNQIILDNRIKCEDKSIRFYIDKIHRAIGNNNKISFQYGCYDVHKKFILRKDGKVYTLLPYILTRDREFCYIVGIHAGKKSFSHYRLDRMRNVNIVEEKFERRAFNAADYLSKSFYMYSGDVETVKLSFSNKIINHVIDRFGRDVEITVRDDKSFEIIIEAAISEGLVRWIMAWGSSCRVISPASLKERVMTEINDMQKTYCETRENH